MKKKRFVESSKKEILKTAPFLSSFTGEDGFSHDWKITRVQNGWLYQPKIGDSTMYGSPVFVPETLPVHDGGVVYDGTVY